MKKTILEKAQNIKTKTLLQVERKLNRIARQIILIPPCQKPEPATAKKQNVWNYIAIVLPLENNVDLNAIAMNAVTPTNIRISGTKLLLKLEKRTKRLFLQKF